jgi:hypothetical protein
MADEATVDRPKPRRNGTKKKSLVTKLTEIMSSIDGVEKKGWNDHHKYAYVMEPELFEAVRGGMAERNLMMVPSITSVERHERGIVTVHMLYRILDGDSGESIEIPWSAEGQAQDDKGIAKAVTNAKYLIMKLFLIPSFFSNGESTDAENPRTEVQPAKPVVKTAPPATSAKKPGCISEKQLKRLHAIARSQNADVDAIKGYAAENFGFESLEVIPWNRNEKGNYDEIIKMIEAGNFTADKPELDADDIPF